MASLTIVAPAASDALAQARQAAERQAELDAYVSFRSVIDGYEEAPRPSVADVESVLAVLGGVVTADREQGTFEPVSRGGAGAPVRFTADGQEHEVYAPGYGAGIREGRTWFLRLSPGVMGLRCEDANKKARAQEREKDRERKAADALAVSIACTGCPVLELRPDSGSTGEIREWSARSRSRMSEKVGSLDYSEWSQEDGALAMVTLTLPSWWQAVAPDGKTFKKLLRRFELRWRRNVGDWRCLWKLEFQRRGAPHWHALMRVPALVGRQKFEEWLAVTWADCVGASQEPDRCSVKTRAESSEYSRHIAAHEHHAVDFSGKDFSDPRRISLYFLGHSSKTTDGKEYQHIVPKEWQEPGKGPGRFWGNPGLESAFREIEITEQDAVRIARVLRQVKRGRAWTTAVLRERGALPVGEREKHKTFSTELRQKAGQKRGRAAHRTYNRNLRQKAEAKGEAWGLFGWQPRFTPSSLGAGGYAVGGWVLMNDALQLGLDVARLFGGTPAKKPALNLGQGSLEERRETVRLCGAARGVDPFRLAALRRAGSMTPGR